MQCCNRNFGMVLVDKKLVDVVNVSFGVLVGVVDCVGGCDAECICGELSSVSYGGVIHAGISLIKNQC